MVGLLGCKCCVASGDDPPWYGPCDCGPIGNFIKGDYFFGYAPTFPADPPFHQPTNASFFLYNERLHLIKAEVFRQIADPTFTYPPLWAASNFPPSDNQDLSLGIEPRNSCFWAIQMGLNEFDYEFSFDLTINQNFKPILHWTWPTRFEDTWVPYASFCPWLYPFSGTSAVQDDVRVSVENFSPDRTLAGYAEITNWRIVIRYGFTSYLGPFTFGTHNIKRKLSCPSFVKPNNVTFSSKWYWDNVEVLSQSASTVNTIGGWTDCFSPPVDPMVSRFLSCNRLYHDATVSNQCLWFQNPSEMFYVDNFVFNAIPK